MITLSPVKGYKAGRALSSSVSEGSVWICTHLWFGAVSLQSHHAVCSQAESCSRKQRPWSTRRAPSPGSWPRKAAAVVLRAHSALLLGLLCTLGGEREHRETASIVTFLSKLRWSVQHKAAKSDLSHRRARHLSDAQHCAFCGAALPWVPSYTWRAGRMQRGRVREPPHAGSQAPLCSALCSFTSLLGCA